MSSLRHFVILLFLFIVKLNFINNQIIIESPDPPLILPPSFPDTTFVTVSCFVNDVYDVNNKDPESGMNVFFEYKWKDDSLTTIPKEGLNWIVPVEYSNFKRSNREASFEIINSFQFNNETKTVTQVVKLKGVFVQSFDFTDFPFDEQDLEIIIECYDESVIFLSPVDEFRLDTGRFTILTFNVDSKAKIEAGITTTNIFFRDIRNTELRVKFEISREFHTYLVDRIIPALFASLLSLTQFYIDYKKHFGQRLSIALFSVVILANIQAFTLNVIPPSDNFTYLEAFALFNYTIMFLSVMELIFVQYLHTKGLNSVRKVIDYSSRFIFPFSLIIINVALLLSYVGDAKTLTIIWSVLTSVGLILAAIVCCSVLSFKYILKYYIERKERKKHDIEDDNDEL